MSQLKYFFIFEVQPSNKTCFHFSLKKSVTVSTFIPISLISLEFIIDIFKSSENFLFILFRHGIFSFGNFISFFYMIKSLNQFDYKKAYLGNLSFFLSFCFHFILFMINTIFDTHFSSIWLYYLQFGILNVNAEQYIIPNIIYLLYELGTTWICYSYTKNLSEGNDALVDGQNFDRYIENLGSDNGSNLGEVDKGERNIEFNSSRKISLENYYNSNRKKRGSDNSFENENDNRKISEMF